MGIRRKFKNVPNPGFSRNGIHKRRTAQLISQVDHPRLIPVLREIPSERTIHGEFPRRDCTNNDSPIPNRKSAAARIPTRNGARFHREFARQGVMGIVRCGRNHSTTRGKERKGKKRECTVGGYLIGYEQCGEITSYNIANLMRLAIFPGIGTLINIVAIILGSTIGVLLGSKMSERTRELITDVLGMTVILAAVGALISLWSKRFIHSLPTGWTLLSIMAALLMGGLIGSAARIEDRLEGMGERLRIRFRASDESPFVEGFVLASLIFAIGPLAILGSISDGMSTGIDQLILKSTLDFFASMAFAASLGWGVALSALPVGIYQGFWTLIGVGLGSILGGYQVDAMTATGGVLLLGIGLKLLKIKEIAVGNLLPALAVAPLFVWGLHAFTR
jgi:uncharacterized membrane protein YqgA involved in biofilm formation